MANVLPEKTRKNILREELARFVLASSLVLLLLAFIAFLSLLPAEIALQIEDSALAKTKASTPAADQINGDHLTLAEAQSFVSTALPYLAATSTGFDAIRAAIVDRPQGISITLISYIPGSKTITLSGAAAASADIASYQSALKSDAHFTDAQIPVGALVSGDRQFSVTLSGNF